MNFYRASLLLNTTRWLQATAAVFIHIQTKGEMFWESIGLTAWHTNEAKSPSPGFHVWMEAHWFSGPDFNPHVVRFGCILEEEKDWSARAWRTSQKHIICSSVFMFLWQGQRRLIAVVVSRSRTKCTGFTTLVRDEKRNVALLLFPSHGR